MLRYRGREREWRGRCILHVLFCLQLGWRRVGESTRLVFCLPKGGVLLEYEDIGLTRTQETMLAIGMPHRLRAGFRDPYD